MRALNSTAILIVALASLASIGSGQKVKNTGTPPPDAGSRPDKGWSGPGDTVPGGPGNPGNNNPNGPPPPDPNAPGPAPSNPADIYGAGANPLAPYKPPGSTPGSASNEPPPITPATRPTTLTETSWQIWWHYNRWAHLELGPGLASTGSGAFYIGRGQQTGSDVLRASPAQMQDIVQPALIKILLMGGRPQLEIYALHALAKLRGVSPDPSLGGFENIVQPSLRSGNQEVSEKAILALGVKGDAKFLPWLTAILNDEPEGRALLGRQRVGLRMRAFAAYGLGLMGERTDAPAVRVAIYDALVQALWLERVEVQAACLLALGLTPMPVGGDYIGEGELFEGRTRVDQILELVNFFEDPEQSFVARSQAPAAIARLMTGAPDTLRGRAVYAFLVASGPHSKELREVQNAAVIALGQLGRSGGDPMDDQVLEQLERIAYKSSGDRSTRFFATTALADAASRRGVGEDPFGAVPAARKVFLQNLGRSRGESQAWTAIALGILESKAINRGELTSPDSSKALRHILKRSRSSEVVGAIAIALGMARDLEAESALRERMLETGEERVRAYTALALGMLGASSSVEDIQRVLTQSTMKPFVIENAAIALSLLGDQEVGSKLLQILERSSRPDVQASVASAMGWIKDPRPLGQLCESLLDERKNETGRSWTAVAIGRICDEDRWPWVGRLSVNAQYDVWLPTLLEPNLLTGLLDLP